MNKPTKESKISEWMTYAYWLEDVVAAHRHGGSTSVELRPGNAALPISAVAPSAVADGQQRLPDTVKRCDKIGICAFWNDRCFKEGQYCCKQKSA